MRMYCLQRPVWCCMYTPLSHADSRGSDVAQDCEEAESLDPKEFAAWFNQARGCLVLDNTKPCCAQMCVSKHTYSSFRAPCPPPEPQKPHFALDLPIFMPRDKTTTPNRNDCMKD